ncbi:hypothetical protein [Stigmatella erecta]|uniref:Uncharacterized protein n=1 Tax=Stigmatella erecta TaxID=83460 RepID=A0A1I0LBP5_9BACT|nr:hypothetical protein [Stigmatella erecta]SEU36992.1 hypothetical protein SAMN05443639_12331 [Stigmatella erecta]
MTRQPHPKMLKRPAALKTDGAAPTKAALARVLVLGGARANAVAWFTETWRTPAEAWAACQRGDWLLRGACRAAVDRAALTLAACACARFAWAHVAPADTGRALLDAAEVWAEERTQAARRRLTKACHAARHLSRGPRYAALGAALYAAETASDPRAAPEAALLTVVSVSSAASFVTPEAFEAVRQVAHAACAELVRRHLPWASIEAALAAPKGRKS